MSATVTAPVRSDGLGGVIAVWHSEVIKLAAHTRTRVIAGLCLFAPFAALVVLQAQSSVPQDTLFGRWVHESGFALPLVILSFSGQWVLPILAGVVAGDIFSSEDHHGTWKAVVTRSRRRSQIFAGKLLAAVTWSVVAVVALAGASILAGLLIGHQPLVDLSGRLDPAGRSLFLVVASWATVIAPTLGFTAVGVMLSVLTRHSVVGIGGPVVLGLVMQLGSLVNGADLIRVLMLTTPLGTWHGLWADPSFNGPLVDGLAVSAMWFVAATLIASVAFARRDIPTA
ncbi:MAG: ABC transporter permease [Actinomycetota bacterium]|nr:ABC transporter permease [Actinomycetota bacterium]